MLLCHFKSNLLTKVKQNYDSWVYLLFYDQYGYKFLFFFYFHGYYIMSISQNGYFCQWILMNISLLKVCVRCFSLFLKDKRISSLVQTNYIEKKFNLQLFFLPTVSGTFILSWATMRYLPPWNFLFRKNNYV